MRAFPRRRAHEEVKNGLPDGRQARLRRRSPDCFFPTRGLEAAGLKESVSDHGHQGVSVQPDPGSALEVVEAEFLLRLLMRLFADPSGFDRGGERPEARVGGKSGHIVFLLARRSALADEPDFIARHALHAIVGHAVFVTVRDADAMDWTDLDADNQSTLALHLVTRHGRAMPLLWLTIDKDELKNQRNDFEDLCLSRLKALLPDGVAVTILADRGFGDVKLFEFLESLRFRYVIRFRGDIHVSAADGETRLAADWVGEGGRARMLRDAEVTATRQKVGAVVCVKAVGMKEAWHLAASDGALSAPRSSRSTPKGGPSSPASATARICASGWA